MTVAAQKLPTPIRLPEDLKAWLKEKSTQNFRSLNSEIIMRLEGSRAAERELQNAGRQ